MDMSVHNEANNLIRIYWRMVNLLLYCRTSIFVKVSLKGRCDAAFKQVKGKKKEIYQNDEMEIE